VKKKPDGLGYFLLKLGPGVLKFQPCDIYVVTQLVVHLCCLFYAGLLKSAVVVRIISVLATLWRGMFAPFYMINR